MKNAKIRRMASIALLMALVVVMQAISSIIPPVSGFPISLVLIPIVLGAALYGPASGAILGATFGVIVYINCVTGADLGGAMVFQANPVLCFLVVMGKGILAGTASGWVYKLLRGKNPYIAMILAAAVCPIVNTGVFITCMLLLFMEVLRNMAPHGDVLGFIISVLIVANFVPELIINLLFSPASMRIVHVVNNKK